MKRKNVSRRARVQRTETVYWNCCRDGRRQYLGLGVRATEGKELPGNDPVEVSVLHLLVVFIFLQVEAAGPEVEEFHFGRLLDRFETVQDRELVGCGSEGCVTERQERLMA